MSKPKKTIHFVSLGCPKNRVDTEVMLGVGAGEGSASSSDPAEAEVIVVNTCGFIGPAKEESIDTILEMGGFKESGSCQKLVVVGLPVAALPRGARQGDARGRLTSSARATCSSSARCCARARAPAERMLVGNPADYVSAPATRACPRWRPTAPT